MGVRQGGREMMEELPGETICITSCGACSCIVVWNIFLMYMHIHDFVSWRALE